jgi:hypothetical protein
MRILKIFLILCVLVIGLKECYYPLPDFTKKDFDCYYHESNSLRTKTQTSVLILMKIKDKESLQIFESKYGKRRRSLKDWTLLLNLSDEQIDKLIKYEEMVQSYRRGNINAVSGI